MMASKSVLVLLMAVVGVTLAEHCCFPDQFEIGEGAQIGVSKFGRGSYVNTFSHIAVDATNDRSGAYVGGAIDGKPFFFQLILDYNKSVEYRIEAKESHCQKFPLKRPMERCVPDEAIPTGSVYLGDDKLTIDSFAYEVKGKGVHGQVTQTVTKGTCIPNSESFSGEMGFSSLLSVVGFFNYTSGISDPATFFTVPDFCPTSWSKEPKMYDMYDPTLLN